MSKRGRRHGLIPPWMVTYADLMSLLLCFFVLLLSFAEIDLIRFKQLAGEMKKAFGVQRQVPAEVIPMGTSAVFDRFSPAEPEPTLRDEVRQITSLERPRHDTHREQVRARVEQRVREIHLNIEDALRSAIDAGGVRVERDGTNVLIRIDEQGTFPSGSAQVTGDFSALLHELSDILVLSPGNIAIDGHTDDIPIRSSRFRSNWDLSAMRAATVANILLENEDLEPSRLTVMGHADTQPLAPNETEQARARNRRVEITLQLGDAVEREVLAAMFPLSEG
ncbi:flagellar motor protein MotB [Halomonas alkalisoli]|uniref:flagellar motor protein MotB n=1 Tax=Halomonas alkalisoli TaxID=2907158 RepID=UPI002102E65C|nr:flagellar motor protein MotB [Halomonas alkalisoli]